MRTKSFRDLIVWQKSYALAKRIYDVTQSFPREERFGLVSQLRRSAGSVPSNIAEGYGRLTVGEYLNQLSVASGSLNELITQLLLSGDFGFLAATDLAAIESATDEVGRMLGAIIRALQQKRRMPPRARSART